MPKEELSYLLVTPYTIAKSRTGGVLSRLLSRLDLELVGAQMFAPTAEFAREYAESVLSNYEGDSRKGALVLQKYILNAFSPSGGRRHRVLLLLFKGENPYEKLSSVAGPLYKDDVNIELLTGETIRDTYADFVTSNEDPEKVLYYEPAVLTPRSPITAMHHLKMISEFIKDEDTVIANMVYPDPQAIERTLVIIKPDNWQFASSKPGTIIDMFSRTGLRIISTKIHQMSVAQALEFYGSVKDVLISKLSPMFAQRARKMLEKEFGIDFADKTGDSLVNTVGRELSIDQFYQIIEFMTGCRPDQCPIEALEKPGKVKSMVLIYEGENAVNKIREVLGPTDPTKAPGGTVRREFGQNVMINTAHASDSPESAVREMKIIDIQHNNCYELMKQYLDEHPSDAHPSSDQA
jgi:nucleoside diphosphate kinase